MPSVTGRSNYGGQQKVSMSIGVTALRYSRELLTLLCAILVGEVAGGETLLLMVNVAAFARVAFLVVRWLLERERARAQGDGLARVVLDRLNGEAPDFGKALIDYFNNDGPAWALPPGEYMITRYDWARDMTAVVAVFGDKGAAEAELDLQCWSKVDPPAVIWRTHRAPRAGGF